MRAIDRSRLTRLATALTADESHLRALLVTTATIGSALLIAASLLPTAPPRAPGVPPTTATLAHR